MYALLFPSAQRFISAVEENVNVDVLQIGALTGPPTPCRTPSPAWIACVCAPSFWPESCPLCFVVGLLFMMTVSLAVFCLPASSKLADVGAGLQPGDLRIRVDTKLSLVHY
jgi:hypothetical protein